jgi:ligand-binding SRPBCC domain-containing protein
MKYTHHFTVHAPIEVVANFHRSASSLKAITPPPLVMHLHAAPLQVGEGDETDFTLWMGPLPVRWVARVEDLTPDGFLDRQVRGPFGKWSHRHHFVPVDAGTTEVHDEVTAELHPQLGWKLVGLGMWLGLPLLFAYRGWRTRKILEK